MTASHLWSFKWATPLTDIGIAGGKGMGILFKNGKVVKTLKERELFGALIREIKKM